MLPVDDGNFSLILPWKVIEFITCLDRDVKGNGKTADLEDDEEDAVL